MDSAADAGGAAMDAGMGKEAARATSGGEAPLFDHEKLEVYQVARQFFTLAAELLGRKMPRDLREQFDSAASSILFNIGEGAGKLSRGDKQRSYEIARGSTTEAATQLDVLHIRRFISAAEYQQARGLLIRVAQMLSRLCGAPRRS